MLKRPTIAAIAGLALAGVVLTGAASAETATATGTLQMKDAYGTEQAWGRSLVLPRAGKVVRVMDATYGFSILNAEGETVGDFLLPQQAVGLELAAGEYSLRPYVCAKHRHHHVELTVEY